MFEQAISMRREPVFYIINVEWRLKMEKMIKSFRDELDDNISKSLEDNTKEFAAVVLNIEIIEEIVGNINSASNTILKEILHDLISGLYSGLQALYRNAYISLRSGMELTLAYIYFLDHNYDYLFWKKDEYDVRWSVLENSETGVLSEKYLSMFCEDNFEKLFASCKVIYKKCSQFVHGKYEYMHTFKQQSVKYDSEMYKDFLITIYKFTNAVMALLLIRHSNLHININEVYKSIIEENLKQLQLADTLKKIKEYWK